MTHGHPCRMRMHRKQDPSTPLMADPRAWPPPLLPRSLPCLSSDPARCLCALLAQTLLQLATLGSWRNIGVTGLLQSLARRGEGILTTNRLCIVSQTSWEATAQTARAEESPQVDQARSRPANSVVFPSTEHQGHCQKSWQLADSKLQAVAVSLTSFSTAPYHCKGATAAAGDIVRVNPSTASSSLGSRAYGCSRAGHRAAPAEGPGQLAGQANL